MPAKIQTESIPLVHLDPAALRVHPLLSDLPEWADDDPQFEALLRDIDARGLDYPIKITASHEIGDGRHRVRGARRLKLATVPCDIIPDDQVPALILSSLCQRRHYTKSALAYMLAPTLRQQAVTQKQFQTLGESIGLSLSLLKDAERVRALFERQGEWSRLPADAVAEFRAEMEPKIIAGEIALGALMAGWAGRESTLGKPKNIRSALDLWDRTFGELQRRFHTWDKFDPETKNSVAARFVPLFESMPDELIQKLSTRISAELKARKEHRE